MSMSVSSTGMAVMQKSLQAFDKAAAMAASQESFANRAGKMTEALVARRKYRLKWLPKRFPVKTRLSDR